MLKLRFCLFALTVAGGLHAATVVPYSFTYTSYSVDLSSFASDVTNVVAVECYSADNSNCGVQRLNFLGPTTGIAAGGQVTVLNNPFLNGDLANPAQAVMLLGIATDSSDQQHLVVFMSPQAATAVNGNLGWSDLFPSVTESAVINQLLLATSGGYNWGNDWNTLSPGLNYIDNFAVPMRSTGPGTGGFPGQTGIQPFLGLPAPGGTATDFDLVEFSNGQIIGDGTASLLTTGEPASETPEPVGFSLAGIGLAALSFRAARRRAS